MAKETVDFVFKADTSSAEKALKSLSDKFANLGKGAKVKLQDIDVQSVIDAVKSVQTELNKLGDSSSIARVVPIM
jgi:hypothetical protein